MINVHHSTYYSQASEIPQRPSDPIGIQSMHFSLQPPLSWSCDCLLSVPSPGQPRAREEHPLLHLGGYKGDLHLACRQTGTNLLRTNEKDAAYISIFCVTDTTWCLEVMGTLRDLQFALQLKIEELRQRDTLIDELELELDTKDELIRRLQEELDRYRATVSLTACSAQGEDNQRAKRETVISEPFTLDPVTLAMVFHRSCDKSQESRKLIQAAFLKNDLLKNLDEGEIRAIIACMYSTTIHQGCYVIQEGTNGAQAYVVEEGRLEMTKDGLKVLTVEPEDMFGEVALLYNCTYTYSVAAQTDSKLWVIDRKSYQTILTQSGLNSLSYSMELLSSVPCLQSLPEDVIMKMSDLLEETHYTEGDYIIRQGAMGDTFYIISKGQVKVTEKKPGHEELSKLSERQWFGEKALWGEDVRAVNVIAAGEVTCLLIDRETFKDIISGLVFDSGNEVLQNTESKVESDKDAALLSSSILSDFQIICTLGVGELGHVDLVQLKSNVKCLSAMRVLKKKLILNNGQREHILREQRILMEAHCPFIVRLHKTFRDAECLYMLTEACLCGDLCSLLGDKGCLDECSTRFYTACVVEALSFLHYRGVVYRDVKPENVVLDEHGYAKLIGFRCAKKIEVGKKTWTFCGTPGYMAPEIILNKGHNISADLWSLGVFVFELLSGELPFSGFDPMKILTATIRGIDQIDFPKTISKSASSLIKKLCRSNPSERLGSQRNGAKNIQKHKWFEGFNWEGLCKGTLSPPLILKVKHLLDSSTYSHYTGDSAEPCTDWDDF
ncbi:cGMP-dependent protein kinase 1 isoform X2 [Thunnus albacares]|uniref:cGMP-dependent protein kinase 1 isoform X2 n=1 Tax=Thunnus albacares TaxID=8236 RepID=UPI001CF68F5B|nr:cGMP-dependent protein kinase 1 isoform X2 [Thunnus albacares]